MKDMCTRPPLLPISRLKPGSPYLIARVTPVDWTGGRRTAYLIWLDPGSTDIRLIDVDYPRIWLSSGGGPFSVISDTTQYEGGWPDPATRWPTPRYLLFCYS